jgi:hypothetical protein
MARVFDSYERLVPTWMAAARHLLVCKKHSDRNLVLEISDAVPFTKGDRLIVATVDGELRRRGTSVETVAGTIFPQGLYNRFGRPDFYQRYLSAMKIGKKPNTWGTYALRLIERQTGVGNQTINPLEIIVQRLSRAKVASQPFQSSYEASVIDPEADLSDAGVLTEAPTYNPVSDANLNRNMPCLSHVSFKLNDRKSVDLTAVYRYQYYGERALGNLIGLARLLKFVATEAKLSIGFLTCISTHAFLDVGSLGGMAAVRELLDERPT